MTKKHQKTPHHTYAIVVKKPYSHRQGLHVHRKQCNIKYDDNKKHSIIDPDLVKALIMQNKEFQTQLFSSNMVINNNTNNTSNNNNTNNFNISLIGPQ